MNAFGKLLGYFTDRAPKPIDSLDAQFRADARFREKADRDKLLKLHPQYDAAIDLIAERTGSTSKHVHRRGADLLAWLETARPKFIVEIGSGRSSIVFAAWSAQNAARYVAFEEHADWRAVTEAAIKLVDGSGELKLIPTEPVADQGRRFAEDIPEGAEFIYLDGPSGKKGGPFLTPDGRPVFFDVPHYLEAGHRPSHILVDGRVSTVLYISGLAAAKSYRRTVSGSVVRRVMRDQSANVLNRHTSFVRIA